MLTRLFLVLLGVLYVECEIFNIEFNNYGGGGCGCGCDGDETPTPTPAPLAIWESDLVLGEINFETSAKHELTQERFELGMAALGLFWYDVAIEIFKECQKGEPYFAMCYWGEIMAQRWPLWNTEFPEKARELLAALDKIPYEATPREHAYINAARARFAIGLDTNARRELFIGVMDGIIAEYPNDVEAKGFKGVELIDLDRAAEAKPVLFAAAAQQPNSANIAHFILHAFDDPEEPTYEPALPSAEVIIREAPSAPHALHMPSHIYDRMGEWARSIISNEAGILAGDTYCRDRGFDALCDLDNRYHAIEFGAYGLLQEGRWDEAQALLERMERDTNVPKFRDALLQYYHRMWARDFLETDRTAQQPILGTNGLPAEMELGFWSSWSEISALFAFAINEMENNGQCSTAAINRISSLSSQLTANVPTTVAWLAPVVGIFAEFLNGLCDFYVTNVNQADRYVTTLNTLVPILARRNGFGFLASNPSLPVKPLSEFFAELVLDCGADCDQFRDEAIAGLEETVSVYNTRTPTVYLLGRLYELTGNTAGARVQYQEVIDQTTARDSDVFLAEVCAAKTFIEGGTPAECS